MSNEKIIKKKGKGVIPDEHLSKVYICKSITEAITTERNNYGISKFKRVKNNRCLNISTGELIEFKTGKTLEKQKAHFKKATNDLRRLINNNFVGNHSEVFLTLTYKEKMTDYEKATLDFSAFWKKLKKKHSTCEYIKIIEPQGNGSFHLHVLIKDISNTRLFLNLDELKKLWYYGNVSIKRIRNASNFGAYFCTRFTPCKDNSKSSIKGTRISFYPENFKLYTYSKGIKKPVPIIMEHGEFLKLAQNLELCYSYTNSIILDDVEVNSITFEQYKNKDKVEIL